LVPRELQVEQKGGVKAMTDDELERAIEAISAMLAAKDAGANAKVIEGLPPVPGPPPLALPAPVKRRRTARKGEASVG
jgi:hypothetical protein